MGPRRILLFVFSHRLLAMARRDLHFILLRLSNFLARKDAMLRKRATSARPIFVNLGPGPRGIADPHWINLDGYQDKNIQFLVDFARPLPFADGSLDGVFCEHVFEHFSQDGAERLARELKRCLRPSGVLRVVVLDAERIMATYFQAPQILIGRRQTTTAIEAVNSYFRQWYDHHFLYDYPTIKLILRRAGFATIIRSKYRAGILSNDIVLDDPKYEWESLYVEAMPHQATYNGRDDELPSLGR
jgi:predicted SAM-dependent methyltransferase